MEIALLGPLRVTAEGKPLNLGGYKSRTLLAVLACHANEMVDADRLVDALWDGSPPRTATQNLRVYVYQLRRLLGSDRRVVWRRPGYALIVDKGELDAEVFEDLARQGRQALASAPAHAASLLVRALRLWRGSALADFTDVRTLRTTAARLEERRLAAVEARVAADLALGSHADLVGELSALVAEHPLREHLRAQLMLSLCRSGRRAEALAVFRDFRRMLVTDLGVEPGPVLQQMHQAVLRDDEPLIGATPADHHELRQIRIALRDLTRRLETLEAAGGAFTSHPRGPARCS
ncbi:MAG TPA: AfsR/SARP family transcriptional regulator [Rugosimonospora sp.]|nr:AfsR/SARP family transcriptional regulator [Rugosimonospora sp.]